MSELKMLRIDDKWQIAYNPATNDRPLYWYRYGNLHSLFDGNNATLALFYALLAKEQN